MTNFVDTNFNTSATGGVLKYNLTHADNTTEQVQMSIATPVQTQGTALNKAFFDTIASDFASPVHTIPSGLICMWSGSTVPTGWYLCNGQNGTPDLRDRFVVGSGSSYSIGATGGENSHTLTVNEMPSHNHDFRYRSSSGTQKSVLRVGSSGTPSVNDYVTPYTINSTTNSSLIDATGGGQAHENRPPYYALAFIMKA